MSLCSDGKGLTLTTVVKRSDGYSLIPAESRNAPLKAGLLEVILASLEASKAEEIVSVDIRERSAFADFMVIASGRSQRHVAAVADQLLRRLKETGCHHIRVEGLGGCDWVLIDSGNIIIYLFRPGVRALYNLEKMWLEPGLAEEKSKIRRS